MNKAAGRVVVHQSQSINHSYRNSMATFANGWVCPGSTQDNEKASNLFHKLFLNIIYFTTKLKVIECIYQAEIVHDELLS